VVRGVGVDELDSGLEGRESEGKSDEDKRKADKRERVGVGAVRPLRIAITSKIPPARRCFPCARGEDRKEERRIIQ